MSKFMAIARFLPWRFSRAPHPPRTPRETRRVSVLVPLPWRRIRARCPCKPRLGIASRDSPTCRPGHAATTTRQRPPSGTTPTTGCASAEAVETLSLPARARAKLSNRLGSRLHPFDIAHHRALPRCPCRPWARTASGLASCLMPAPRRARQRGAPLRRGRWRRRGIPATAPRIPQTRRPG